jgi:phosphoenolpyruvate synthase/pyruvate phosphate dikinase
MSKADLVIDLSALRMKDVAVVGGKNASLGEMISQLGGAGVRVPGGFATTANFSPRAALTAALLTACARLIPAI